jgi:hypothetical protein
VFSLFPPLALYAHNQRFYRLPDLALPVAGTLLVTLLLWLGARLVWKDAHERAFRVFALVFCFHLSGHAASAFRGLPVDLLGREADLGALLGWAVGLVALGLLASRMPAGGPAVTRVLSLFSVVLVAMPSARIAKAEAERFARKDLDFGGGAWSAVRPVPPAEAPHVFYVVLDAYARHDVLAAEYGLDNTPFLEALRGRGFYVASRSECNSFGTAESLASSLNMSYLDDLAREAQREADDWSTNRAISHNQVARALRTKGYSFVAFGNGIATTEAREADVFLDVASVPVVDGKFFQTAVGLTPLRGMGFGFTLGEARTLGLHRERVLHTLEKAPGLARSRGPVFALVHVVCPHSPYVFDRQGNDPHLSPHDTSDATLRRAYADQVVYLNGRVLGMIDAILGASTRPVVIVVQGDHGPGPIPARVGREVRVSLSRRAVLNAFLFPDRNYERLYDTITPVNTFRVVLSQHLGFDIPLLPERRAAPM